jgi:hypothetical protein
MPFLTLLSFFMFCSACAQNKKIFFRVLKRRTIYGMRRGERAFEAGEPVLLYPIGWEIAYYGIVE